MRKLLTILLLAGTATALLAQDEPPPASAASKAYRAYREQAVEPTYSLAKIKALVKKLKPDQEDTSALSTRTYNSLSVQEKFTYTMIHAEVFSQNCSVMPPLVNEEKMIFAYPVGAFNDEGTWSERQQAFLKNNRTRVIALLRETIRKKNRVGVNLKQAVVTTNAIELIPDLAKAYNGPRKDHDILTVLMLLMKENKYGPFLASTTYEKLYGDDSNYQAHIEATVANQKLVLERAKNFHESRMKK